MNSARQFPRPFSSFLGPEPADRHGDDEASGLHLRRDWGEAGHRLDDEAPERSEAEASLDLLLSLYSPDAFAADDTVVGASPAEPAIPIDVELPSVDVELSSLEAELPSIEVELPPEEAEVSIDVDVDVELPDEEARALEVSVAPSSESHLWEGFDGELGVFVATYEPHALGARFALTLHLTHERSVTTAATVRFLRDAEDGWPGVGLELDAPSAALRAAFRRFARLRRPAFWG